MKKRHSLLIVLFGILLLVVLFPAHAESGKAIVRAVRGEAEFSVDNAHWQRLRSGNTLRPGARIRTKSKSQVDLFLGVNGPLMRLRENTVLELKELSYTAAQDQRGAMIDTSLKLLSGEILGAVKVFAHGSKFIIETPSHTVRCLEMTAYKLAANGEVFVRSGLALLRFPGAELPQTINAGRKYDAIRGQIIPGRTIKNDEFFFNSIGNFHAD